MARATGYVGRQATSVGLLALLTACAVVQEPPGGPPDFADPVLVSVTPDSGSIADSLRGGVVFQFDEVISERSGGGLEGLFLVFPRPEELIVDWKRDRIEVRPRRGWRDSLIYHVTMLPGITDLRSNQLEDTRHVVFSTGGPIPDTRMEGYVLDWETHRVGVNAAIEAILLPDSLVYGTRADSVGHYTLSAVPTGTYLVVASIDANNNGQRDRREPFDSITTRLDSVFERDMWAFQQDTTGPQLGQSAFIDSVTVRVQFNKKLALGDPPDDSVRMWSLPDTTAWEIAAVWNEPTYDSVVAAERAAADSARAAAAADSAAADTAATDTADADSATAVRPPGEFRVAQEAEADSTPAQRLLAARPPLQSSWIIRLATPMPPGSRYLIEASATAPNGVAAESRTVLVLPDPEDSP